ncbi:hypothetical protein Tco_1346813 [Tanacetum coccineum]
MRYRGSKWRCQGQSIRIFTPVEQDKENLGLSKNYQSREHRAQNLSKSQHPVVPEEDEEMTDRNEMIQTLEVPKRGVLLINFLNITLVVIDYPSSILIFSPKLSQAINITFGVTPKGIRLNFLKKVQTSFKKLSLASSSSIIEEFQYGIEL